MTRRGLTAYLAAAVVLGGGLAARAAGLSPMHVTSGSMAPAADRGDWIIVRSVDDCERPQLRQGDIVLFSFPLGSTGRAIKRVAAVAHDRVTFTPRSISVNGRTQAIGGSPIPGPHGALTVPHGQLFLLGTTAQSRSTAAHSEPSRRIR